MENDIEMPRSTETILYECYILHRDIQQYTKKDKTVGIAAGEIVDICRKYKMSYAQTRATFDVAREIFTNIPIDPIL